MKHIFEPVKMNHIELKNRLIRSATWEGIANPDGSVTDVIHAEGVPVITQLALGAYYREVNGRLLQTEPDYMTAD